MAPVDGRNITNWSPITQTRLRHMRRSFCRDVAQPWGQRKVTVKSPCQVQISSAFFSACMWGTMEHHHTTAAKLPDGWIHSNLITVFKPLLDCYCLNGLEPQNRTKCAVHVSLSLQTFFFERFLCRLMMRLHGPTQHTPHILHGEENCTCNVCTSIYTNGACMQLQGPMFRWIFADHRLFSIGRPTAAIWFGVLETFITWMSESRSRHMAESRR
jgi:hypothetical protein